MEEMTEDDDITVETFEPYTRYTWYTPYSRVYFYMFNAAIIST